jgi:hypothetical protein
MLSWAGNACRMAEKETRAEYEKLFQKLFGKL